MPTGYTAAIAEGITFEKFAMNCARAFGACITMRDDPADKPIPDEFEPSTWHVERITEAEKEIKKLAMIDVKTASELAEIEYKEQMREHEESIRKDNGLLQKYNAMLLKVRNWNPPTPDHVKFKEFMIEQIESSIKFDCISDYRLEHAPKLLTGEEWISKKRAQAVRDLDYHTRENQAEITRAADRTAWVKALRGSLGTPC